MPDQLKFRDNFGEININTRTGRPTKNPRESLGDPISIRLYENEKEAIKECIYQSGLSRNEVIQKCIQVGVFAWPYLDWIFLNMDTIQHHAERYNRKRGTHKITDEFGS